MQNLPILESQGQRVLTSNQIAEEYGCNITKIKQNFRNNKRRFIEGKHYIYLCGDELREFKNKVEKIYPVGDKVNNLYLVGNRARLLYLWTEKGALLHAKSLNTDKAWEVYDYLGKKFLSGLNYA